MAWNKALAARRKRATRAAHALYSRLDHCPGRVARPVLTFPWTVWKRLEK
jgi:hypothetical protein